MKTYNHKTAKGKMKNALEKVAKEKSIFVNYLLIRKVGINYHVFTKIENVTELQFVGKTEVR